MSLRYLLFMCSLPTWAGGVLSPRWDSIWANPPPRPPTSRRWHQHQIKRSEARPIPCWLIDQSKDWTQPQHLHLLYSRCELRANCAQDRPRSVTSPRRIRKQDNRRAHENHLPCDKHGVTMTNLVHRINEDIYSSKAGRCYVHNHPLKVATAVFMWNSKSVQSKYWRKNWKKNHIIIIFSVGKIKKINADVTQLLVDFWLSDCSDFFHRDLMHCWGIQPRVFKFKR